MTTKILFVCTGNICRSPTAHAIALNKALQIKNCDQFIFDSAGTTSYHQGEDPDLRAVECGNKKGISFSGIKSRKINQQDFENFDYIFCMDRSHLSSLYQITKPKYHNKIYLFLEFCALNNFWDDEVIDPYYGERGFDEVFDILDKALDKMFYILTP